MQLQDTDWQTSMATNRIGEPSSWTPVAARFGDGDPVYGLLYYSPTGCYFVPDDATQENPQGIQSLMWGPGLEARLAGEAGDAGEHAVVEMAGTQMSIAADHGAALVRLATEGSAPRPASPIPAQPTPGQTYPQYQTQQPPAQPQPPANVQPPATAPATANMPAAAAPATANMPAAAAPAPGVYPAEAAPSTEVAKKGGGTRQRALIYVLIGVVILGGAYAAYTFLLS